MKISEMIAALEAMKSEHGDLDVDTYSEWMGRCSHAGPEIAYRKILIGRESKPGFWSPHSKNADTNKGEKVCRL